jgi:hypothetical protein
MNEKEARMLSRRDLFAGGGVLTQLRPAPAAAQRCDNDIDNSAINAIAAAVRDLRHPAVSPIVTQVRDRQRSFLRQNQKFPDFIDIGVRVWEGLEDWHVENHQELKIRRSAEGRYMMEFRMTELVLKTEMAELEVGLAYDR